MQKANQELHHLQKTIGQNIHNIRCKKKLTLKKFSRLTGISINLLDQYELGKNHIHLNELVRIASALNTKIEFLMQSDIRAFS